MSTVRTGDQRSAMAQLQDLYRYAIEEGMYDAADCMKRMWPRIDLSPPGDPITPKEDS